MLTPTARGVLRRSVLPQTPAGPTVLGSPKVPLPVPRGSFGPLPLYFSFATITCWRNRLAWCGPCNLITFTEEAAAHAAAPRLNSLVRCVSHRMPSRAAGRGRAGVRHHDDDDGEVLLVLLRLSFFFFSSSPFPPPSCDVPCRCIGWPVPVSSSATLTCFFLRGFDGFALACLLFSSAWWAEEYGSSCLLIFLFLSFHGWSFCWSVCRHA